MRKTIILMLSLALVACAAKQPKMEDECLYSPSKTQFAFWSNVAEQMEIHLYDAADAAMTLLMPLSLRPLPSKKAPTISGRLLSKATLPVSTTPYVLSKTANGLLKHRVSLPKRSLSTVSVPRSSISQPPTLKISIKMYVPPCPI